MTAVLAIIVIPNLKFSVSLPTPDKIGVISSEKTTTLEKEEMQDFLSKLKETEPYLFDSPSPNDASYVDSYYRLLFHKDGNSTIYYIYSEGDALILMCPYDFTVELAHNATELGLL